MGVISTHTSILYKEDYDRIIEFRQKVDVSPLEVFEETKRLLENLTLQRNGQPPIHFSETEQSKSKESKIGDKSNPLLESELDALTNAFLHSTVRTTDDDEIESDLVEEREVISEIRCKYLLLNGIAAYGLSRYKESISALQESMALAEELHSEIWEICSFLARSYDRLGDYSRALDYLHQAYETLKDGRSQNSLGIISSQIGTVFLHQGDFTTAIAHYLEALQLFEAEKNLNELAKIHNNIGVLYRKSANLELALRYFERSIELHHQSGDIRGNSYPLYHLGLIHQQLNQNDVAVDFFNEGLKLAIKSTDRYILCSLYEGLGKSAEIAGAFDTAIEHYQHSLSIAEEIGSKESIYEAHRHLSECYKSLKMFELALFHFEAFHRAEEEVFSLQSNERISKLRVLFEVESKERESEIYRNKNHELAALNEKLESANKIKSELLSLAAHDLKNPLQSISGFADLMIEKNEEASENSLMAGAIRRNAAKMLKIISDLLQMSYAESGQLILAKTLLDLSEVAFEVVQENRVIASRKNQNIFFQGSLECITLADELRVREIFDNLLSNAIKYSQPEKNVWCKVERRTLDELMEFTSFREWAIPKKQVNDWILFSVRDEGLGFTKEEEVKLYGKFQKLSAQPTGGETSTGLGLSIVKKFAELHEGTVWAFSAGKETGSTFTVAFPLIVPQKKE
ncbi:MAG: tetratricopeptide repeat protein [Chloroherpetonaceae bacterium]|nr:tetratricopeptide repeat protein [Chloroherpetonaceae bacterium]